MNDWVPSTEQVRSHYVFDQSNRWDAERGVSFDRWLNEIKAEAWYEGFCKGEQSGVREMPLNPREWNPYQEGN